MYGDRRWITNLHYAFQDENNLVSLFYNKMVVNKKIMVDEICWYCMLMKLFNWMSTTRKTRNTHDIFSFWKKSGNLREFPNFLGNFTEVIFILTIFTFMLHSCFFINDMFGSPTTPYLNPSFPYAWYSHCGTDSSMQHISYSCLLCNNKSFLVWRPTLINVKWSCA